MGLFCSPNYVHWTYEEWELGLFPNMFQVYNHFQPGNARGGKLQLTGGPQAIPIKGAFLNPKLELWNGRSVNSWMFWKGVLILHFQPTLWQEQETQFKTQDCVSIRTPQARSVSPIKKQGLSPITTPCFVSVGIIFVGLKYYHWLWIFFRLVDCWFHIWDLHVKKLDLQCLP